MAELKYKKVSMEIPNDVYISKIESIIGKVKNITIEAVINDFKAYEFENTMFVILNLEDSSGKISGLLVGNRDADFKSLVKNLEINKEYRLSGSINVINEDFWEELEAMEDIASSIKKYILGKKLLAVRAIQKINKY